MLKTLIVEDEQHCIDALLEHLQPYKQIKILGIANNLSIAKQKIEQLKPDLLFLDIELPDGVSFELLAQFPTPNFQVIFTTGHNDYAIKAFRHSAVDYLLKPIEKKELDEAVRKVFSNRNDNQRQKLELMIKSLEKNTFSKLALPGIDSFELVEKKDIMYCEAEGSYTNIYTADTRKIVTTHPLKKLDSLLFESHFFRLHKSHVININFIKKILKSDGGQVLMGNDEIVPIARRRKDEFFELLGM